MTSPFHAAQTSTAINTTLPLSGGGDLSASRTLEIIGGTAGQVLASNGPGQAPTFQSASAVTSFQAVYDGGNTVATTTARPVALSNAVDATDLLTLTRTFAGAGGGIAIEMAAGTTGIPISVTASSVVNFQVDKTGNVDLGSAASYRCQPSGQFAFAGDGSHDGAYFDLEGSSSVGVRNFNSGQFTTFYADTVIVGTQASGGVNIVTGTGDPENNVAAPQGSLFLRRDGAAATTLYVKTSGGTGNTGWTAK